MNAAYLVSNSFFIMYLIMMLLIRSARQLNFHMRT